MSVRVRPATTGDADWLAEVSRTSFASRLRPYLVSAQPGIGRFWEIVLRHPTAFPERCFLVAESDVGERLGFADLQRVGPDRAHLSYVCVIDAARGRGVARALLHEYVVRHPDVVAMQLDVFDDNRSARALYDRLGFEAETTSTWWVTDLVRGSVDPDPEARLQGLHAAEAWLQAYGFGELSVEVGDTTLRLGRPSVGVLRCFDAGALERPGVVAAVMRELPELDEALVIVPGDIAPPSSLGALRHVNRSIRMSATDIRARLEPK